jgi:hypothetical protein
MPGCRRSGSLRRLWNAVCGLRVAQLSNRLVCRLVVPLLQNQSFPPAEISRFQQLVGTMGPRHAFGLRLLRYHVLPSRLE